MSPSATITPERLERFTVLIRARFDASDVQTRKSYLQSVVQRIEVDDDQIRIMGDKRLLEAAIAAAETGRPGIRGFVRDWRTRQDETQNWYVIVTIADS